MGTWRFDVLGDFSATYCGDQVQLPGRKLRTLLVALLLRAGRSVPEAELVDHLWDDPPPKARSTLQVYVVRLRQALSRGGRDGLPITRSNSGYRIEITADRVDALRFRMLLSGRDRESPNAELDRLREALALWRGTALSGVVSESLHRDEVVRLNEEWVNAQQRRMELELAGGGHRAVIGELRRLVDRFPLSEVFRRQFMLALHRCGRSAEALEIYRTGRRLLVEELGVEPGTETSRLHEMILRGDTALSIDDAASKPECPPLARELPSRLVRFSGRAAELDGLDEMLGDSGEARVIAVVGGPGVGKTALAVQWAHRVSRCFPDGQLFVDLHGYSPCRELSPAAVLARLNRSLGATRVDPGAGIDELSSHYRSLLNGRRVLVLLDNAVGVDQVRPLLPGGTGSLVLVTSRDSMRGLAAVNDAQVLLVDRLGDHDGVTLLSRIVGQRRVAAEPSASAELVRLCDGLPLAVRIAAVDLAGRPDLTVTDYVDELRGRGRLERLALDDDPTSALREVIDRSFVRLPVEVQGFFRRLGDLPGTAFTAAHAAATTGLAARETERCLDRLVAASLLRRQRHDRFVMHDLLREYASSASLPRVG